MAATQRLVGPYAPTIGAEYVYAVELSGPHFTGEDLSTWTWQAAWATCWGGDPVVTLTVANGVWLPLGTATFDLVASAAQTALLREGTNYVGTFAGTPPAGEPLPLVNWTVISPEGSVGL